MERSDRDRYLANLQAEVDGAALYRALAEIETGFELSSVYTRMAEASLSDGVPVVLDATFLDADQRAGAAAVAARAGAVLVLVETVCDEATVAARLSARAQRGDSPSDASWATFRRQLAAMTAAPPPVPHSAVVVQVTTTTGLPGALDPVFAGLVRVGIAQPIVPTASAGVSRQ